MAREIRITIDDPEVFEVMKQRKDDLDLSWEEVLHRGLRDQSPLEQLQEGPTPLERLGIDDPVGRELFDRLRASQEPDIPSGSYRAEVDRVQSAENGVLTFDFLDEDPRHQVPVRVKIKSTPTGLDVQVVSIRQGKEVADYNRFTEDLRSTIAREMNDEGNAVLYLENGREEYVVSATFGWSRENDHLVVDAVTIDGVEFDD